MITRLTIALLVIAAIGPLAATGQDKRAQQWEAVEEAVHKGFPKIAIQQLNPIIDGAIQDNAYAEAIKAIADKIALETSIRGNRPEEKFTRMEAEIIKAPPEMVPVMNAILADWYWRYVQENRRHFMRRTAGDAPLGRDFTTWDLPRLLVEIDKQFTKSLAAESQLKKIPIAEYDDLLTKGTMPDSYRPTLFDFLAHEALGFYTSDEQAAEDAFELAPDGPIFAAPDEFLKWDIQTTDTHSPTLKAIRLYQNLLRFHRDDVDPAAKLNSDLERVTFGRNVAFGEKKNARYKAALKRFVDRWGNHPISAGARYQWALVLQDEEVLVEAHELAQQGARAFPEIPGGKLCYNLALEIEDKYSKNAVDVNISYRAFLLDLIATRWFNKRAWYGDPLGKHYLDPRTFTSRPLPHDNSIVISPGVPPVNSLGNTSVMPALSRASDKDLIVQPNVFSKEPAQPLKELTVDLGSGVKLELVVIPAGKFMMGSPHSEVDEGPLWSLDLAKPQHRVRITKPFHLGKYLVTQEQWIAVMDSNPSYFKGTRNPVERVSWDDCQEFLKRLNTTVGGGGFCLPTEAQWEYACRAGSSYWYCYGNDPDQLDQYAWYYSNAGSKTHPVGEKKPNAWGLYDMHGSVRELCSDYWGDGDYYAKSPVDDPQERSARRGVHSIHMTRGGSYDFAAWQCRSATRHCDDGHRDACMGFRVARVPVDHAGR